MTVTAAETRVEYAGNDTTTIFAYPYQFYQVDDLDVWLFTDATGDAVEQLIGTDYTVTGAMNPSGGNLTMTVAPPSGTTLIIINNPDIVQTTHYVNADDFPADSHEQALDRLTKIAQRLSDRIDRAVRAPDYSPEDQVPDADTLIQLVDEAEAAAENAINSAQGASDSANAAQASQTAAFNSASDAATAETNAETAETNAEAAVVAAQAQATAAAASATAASGFADAADASADASAASALEAQVAQMVWKGPWSAATPYEPNDGVETLGSSYIAKTNNTNADPPTSPADWDLMASKGAAGPPGSGGSGSGDMLAANNLSDVADVPTSRTNLGLGNAATKNIGTTAGTVMAGDDARLLAKADKTYVDTQDAALQTSINAKPSTAYVDAADAALQDDIDTKATTAYVDAQNATQNTAISAKADTTYVDSQNATQTTAINLKAPLASPVFTGNPQAPTPSASDNDTSIATTAMVQAAIAASGSAGLPAFKKVVALMNGSINSPFVTANPVAGERVFWAAITADGRVLTAGSPGEISAPMMPARGAGIDRNANTAFDLRSISLPGDLMGIPEKLYFNGYDLFVLTDEGDVCACGDNNSGASGTGTAAGTALHVMTLLSATNITPRSAGGVSRRVLEIATSGPGNQSATAASTFFRCADGTLWACGENGSGQLAQGNTTDLNVPTQCLKNDGAGNVAADNCAKLYASGGNSCSVAYLDTSGKLRLCGALRAGSPGRNTAVAGQNVFRPVFTVTDGFGTLPAAYVGTDVIIQAQDTVVLRCADKCAYVWGYGVQGQMGDGTIVSKNNPQKLGVGTAVAGTLDGTVERIFNCHPRSDVGGFICQLTSGAVYCWGQKSGNNLPIVTADGNISTPTQAQGLLSGAAPQIVSVSGTSSTAAQTDYSVYALLADDKVLAWGNNFINGTTQAYSNSSNPQEVSFSRRGNTVAGVMCMGGMEDLDVEVSLSIMLSDGSLLVAGEIAPVGHEPEWDETAGYLTTRPKSWALSEASIP